MLTRKQQELLRLIQDRIDADGVPPSFDEMKDALDLRSKSGIHRLITALEERGFIRRLPNRARAIEIVRRAGGDTPAPAVAADRRPIARSEGRSAVAPARGAVGGIATVPLMGRIAAGVPISAIQDHSHDIPVPADMIGLGAHYALTVRGDSMVGAGILDGDIVLIRETQAADGGDIVVALVDEEEATLKRFRRVGKDIALEAENPAYETRQLPAGRVKVQGRLVGLLRRY